jgi:hypothetical protein
MQIGKDLNEALDGLLAGIDSLLADRDLATGAMGTAGTALRPEQDGHVGANATSAPAAVVTADTAVLSALALACQSQSMGRDAQQTYRALLRKALQERAIGLDQPQADRLKGLIRPTQAMALSPRWLQWFVRLGRSGSLSPVTPESLRFVPDEPLDADDWAVLSTAGPLSVLVKPASAPQDSTPADLMVRELILPMWPELQPIPADCQLQDVMPMAELDQQSPCLIYWLDHWLASHPTVLGLALPLRPMPALSELSWATLVWSTRS